MEMTDEMLVRLAKLMAEAVARDRPRAPVVALVPRSDKPPAQPPPVTKANYG